MKKSLTLAAFAAIVLTATIPLATSADARGVACSKYGFTRDGKACFKFEGNTWVVTNGKPGVPITRVEMTHGFDKRCPQLAIRIDKTNKAPALTDEQKFAGDKGWHVACDRSVPVPWDE